jgi:DNA-directed RNA polymerase specialized sigma24 family protein
VGRWIQRYPQIEARLGASLSIDDIVEDVFLTAFDGFRTGTEQRLGEWLEKLIHQSVRLLLRSPAEKENVRLVRAYADSRGIW